MTPISLLVVFFLLEKYNSNLDWVGLAFTIGLAGATFLNFLGWCAGCWFFGFGVKMGFVPASVYQVFTSILAEQQFTWDEINSHKELAPPNRKVTHLIDVSVPTKIDLKWKDKIDDYGKQDFHHIKHVKITHYLGRSSGVAGF